MNSSATYNSSLPAGKINFSAVVKYVAKNLVVSNICVNTHTHILTTYIY